MAVTAKFKVTRLTPQGDWATEVELTPDYAQGKNAEWASATPAGVIRLTISNKDALEQFTQYRAATVLFTFEDE